MVAYLSYNIYGILVYVQAYGNLQNYYQVINKNVIVISVLDLCYPGFFGEVFRGIWNGTEVAIKVFLEQDLTAENMEDFCNEISILRYLTYLFDVSTCVNGTQSAVFVPLSPYNNMEQGGTISLVLLSVQKTRMPSFSSSM